VQPTLEVVSGVANQRLFRLGSGRLSIGRAIYNDLVLHDQKVSRKHASISFEKGLYVLDDLNSTNGVFVDGDRINAIQLRSGNRIVLGDTILLFTQPAVEVSPEDKVDFINKSALFNWLDEGTKQLLARSLLVQFFPKETLIVRQNTLVESMYFLYSGSVRVVEINEEGGERVLDQILPGGVFAERSLLAGESGSTSMITSTDSYVLELRKERLNELLQKKPELNKAFYRMLLRRLSAVPETTGEKDPKRDHLRPSIISTEVQIVGEDRRIKDARNKLQALAKEGKAALIVGATGTGKKAFARFFHQASPNLGQPYVEISVIELGEGKVGPAIFGLETEPDGGLTAGELGYLEMIGSGTLAIAHAELLDAHQQSKLVTYLKYGWFHRVYGRESIQAKTNVLFLATGTEAEVLERLIPELREILKEAVVVLPSLTQRLKDIPILAEHYLKVFSKRDGKRLSELSREATERLVSYNWPGNIQELENVIQRAVIVASEDVIIPGDLIFVVPSEKELHKINILHDDRLRGILRHPLVPKIFVWFNILMVILMAGFTLFGGSQPPDHPLQEFANNPGMLITWLIWFPLLPISAFVLGRIWCGMCPIAGIGDLVARVRLNLPVPKFLKRLDFWMVVASFIFLDYVEDFFGVAEKPLATGLLLVIIISLSAVFCILFERKTFCRYVCPLAGMLGAYATMSIVEVRGNKKVCQTQCGEHSCYRGTEYAQGCPMFSYPASLSTNSECMMCLNCLKSCENRGVQVNLRPPLHELWHQAQPLLSLSLFGVMLVGLMGRHQFTHLTWWHTYRETFIWSEPFIHTVLYLFFIGLALLPFFFSAMLSAAASQERLSENMAQYGMAFIPLALAGHIAHVSHEFLGEGIYKLIQYMIKLYHSLILGVPIGSREVVVLPFIHPSVITFIKFLLISGGTLCSLVALVMIARRASERRVMARIMPYLLLLTFFWVGYLLIFLGGTGATPEATVAAPAATSQAAPAAGTEAAPAAAALQKQTGMAASAVHFTLTIPDIKDAASGRMNDPAVVKWLGSAKPVAGTKQQRLTVQGQISGAPRGAQVRGGVETGALNFQFTSPLDPKGNFTGEIFLDNPKQPMPLVFELLDVSNSVVTSYRVVLN
jgi:transcriptional regulator with AAA-type ATPase domain/pSer/pThr/pTyr-binding forkhead associated (FHA) protein/polyferredoxin